MRFNHLLAQLPGISAKTLTDVLKELQRTGLAKREAFAEIPPRVQYHLTKEGRELTILVAPLMAWADKMTNLIELEV
jgi:DNA-binding HxlR family transcriptional regulator